LSRLQSHVLREARQFASPDSHPWNQMRQWTRVATSRAVRVLSKKGVVTFGSGGRRPS
jgi:hypothetical protein